MKKKYCMLHVMTIAKPTPYANPKLTRALKEYAASSVSLE